MHIVDAFKHTVLLNVAIVCTPCTFFAIFMAYSTFLLFITTALCATPIMLIIEYARDVEMLVL